ncbi:L-serine dehydratase, iron-sulfur-dependent subunit beta [Exiguobacterium sp. U13-1]|uniref:L-serine deaminase n=1 Tax=Exiguobacterium acetylicum TaxID=41170 RepID=A0ABX8G6D8_EXIAC|nr:MULTISPECIES: L-serine ammonia-lyase, iron-sulfur-dependent subunit beta [Exiguobacterium]AOT01115.1 L-serine dehydratase, iron-sulfur-dependent subunit beta [Exiguobacterium sp. U13-1]QWB29068.1 L-serine ammonia-lyase, iron-sulfur-dependent subunit beta [Exiguobacterium acetylicum]HBQ75842.1 L-serine ammonia-lyase, iron-sulfur-dependent, subunit beta [Exiguobacterium sp.]
MKYRSVFDIIGPVMVGPSSSHTAGAARIGLMAGKLFGETPTVIHITFYGSFADTYRGHGTDVAIIGGVLGYDTFDDRIPQSIDIAKSKGIEIHFETSEALTDHPNTARVHLSNGLEEFELVGISIGGGTIEITELNGVPLRLSGGGPALVVLHHDRFGAIAAVTSILADYEINIGHMEVSRHEKGKQALMAIEIDDRITAEVLEEIDRLPQVERAVMMGE